MAQRSRDHRAAAGLNPAQGPPVATYQTRVSGYVGWDREAGDAALATYAELYGQVERRLFAEVAAGRPAAPLKRDYMREHGIPARMFNAVRVSLEGKVSAVRAAQRLRWTAWSGELLQGNGGLRRPRNRVGGSRFTRSGGGWPIFDTGWLDWRPTLRRAGLLFTGLN